MKYPAYIYAKALAEVIDQTQGEDAKKREGYAQNFLALVRRNGDEVHLRKIVEEAARFARGKSGVRKVAIASARTLTAAQRKTLGHFVKTGDVIEEEVIPELIAGVKIVVDDEQQFDGSLKGKLDKLFGTL